MTPDAIAKLVPGPELDRLVAEKVMGICPHEWVRLKRSCTPAMYAGVYRCSLCGKQITPYLSPIDGDGFNIETHRFSEDIRAAWMVVAKLKKEGKVEPGSVLSAMA